MRLNSRFLWLSHCLFNSKFKFGMSRASREIWAYIYSWPSNFYCYINRSGYMISSSPRTLPQFRIGIVHFLLSQKFLSIVPSSVPVSLGIRFSACSIYDSTNSVIQWHLWYKTQYVPLWKIWKLGRLHPSYHPSIHSTWILSWPFPGYCLQLFSGRFLVCSCVDRF